MSSPDADPLFERAVVAAVADDVDVDEDELRSALDTHQESVESLPGVENIVYEWRKEYADPLLERTEEAYYLLVPERVWAEFAEHLDLSAAMETAVVEVHRRTVAARTDCPAEPPESAAYVALSRDV
ncbi:hypothetical protein [Halomicrobium salinisoli]|uniref:hypothetical protein n=1 Tax=Halomicrobium salinisoli TaxID=2878391 RepID=UPI001CF06E4C|nr:hypothetical protein [Halomicrobium salinisoli]